MNIVLTGSPPPGLWGTMLLIAALPLLLAVAALWRNLRPLALAIAPWSALPALGLALWSPSNVAVELPRLFLGMRLGLDEVERMFLVGTVVLWTLVGISAHASFTRDPRQHRFFIPYLVAMAGNLGLFMVQDLPTFTLCYALMTFAAYGLIIYEGNPAAQRAGRIYLILAVIGEALLLEAVLLITAAAGSQELTGVPHAVAIAPTQGLILVLLFAGFSIKMGVLPVHVWTPLAYSAAPIGASAILSGAMVLAGFWGWVRLFPMGEISLPGWGIFGITVGTVSLLYGVSIGLCQKNPRAILAYFGISQVGLITTGLGVCMVMPEIWVLTRSALVPYALHHVLVIAALFLGLTILRTATGVGQQQRWVGIGLMVLALSLAGAPLTSGALVKNMFHTATAMTPWAVPLSWLLALTAIGSTVLMGRFLVEAWQQARVEVPQDCFSLTARIWLPWAILLLCGVLSVWVVPRSPSFEISSHLWSPFAVWGNLWPLLLGGLLVWKIEQKQNIFTLLAIPRGDLVVWAEWSLQRAQECWYVLTKVASHTRSCGLPSRWYVQRNVAWASSILEEVEEQFGQWRHVGVAFLLLAVLFVTLIMVSA